MRQFLALDLSDRTREQVGAIRARLHEPEGWRWIAPGSLHLTLRFLGDVRSEIDTQARAGWIRAATGVRPFGFRLAGLGCFPPGGRPRVLWLGVHEGSGRLAELAAALERAAVAAGFPAETRPFRPHLTLARATGRGRARRPAAGDCEDEWVERASRAVLFRSLLGPGGARYTALASFPLGERGDSARAGGAGLSATGARVRHETIGVIGGGAWGTALAVHLGRLGHDVRLWIREPEVVERMIERRDNPAYLPGVAVPERVRPARRMADVVDDAEFVISSVPAQFARGTFRELAPHVGAKIPVVVTSKGIEEKSLALPLDVAEEELGGAGRLAVLSGPSFAREVASGLPTAVVVASAVRELSERLQRALSSRELRIYTNGDPVGVQLAAALKNVMAIAVGIGDGLGLGTNARAGLITRCLAEIRRLVIARGGDEGTASGLAGLGDLVLTCTGELSRNRGVGQRLGRGERLEDVLEGSRSVAEGVRTARAARDLARRHAVDMPIVEGVYRILYEEETPERGLDRLLSRPLTSEDEPARNSER